MLLWNILLAVIWCSLQGDFSIANLIGGFLLGYGLLFLLANRGIVEDRSYVRKLPRTIGLVVFFIKELVIANVRLAFDILTPGLNLKPRFLAMPLDAKTDAEIMLTASLINLTPGTLSMEISPDRSTLFIHAIYVKDEAELIRELKDGFEARVLEVLR